MKRDRDLELMQLHDGELTDAQAEALERALAAEDQGVLDGLDQLGDVVRAHAETRAAGFDIADGLMARLDDPAEVAEAPPAPKAPKAKVVPLPPSPASLRRRQVNKRVVVAGVGLAAAAAVALYFVATPNRTAPAPVAVTAPAPVPSPVVAPRVEPTPAVEPATDDETAETDDAAPAVAIEAVDFGNREGSIFMVTAGEESTPVVWLVDEPAAARMEPL